MSVEHKRIFVTGGSGFLGRHLLLDSVNNNFQFFILTRNRKKYKYGLLPERVNVLEGGISEIEKFMPEISSCNYFIHIAGEKKDESKMEDVNVRGIEKILDVLGNFPHIKILYVSSGGVYGIRVNPENILSENVDCFPSNLYERTKVDAENVLKRYARKYPIKFTILRPSNVFGEFDQHHKLLNLIRALKKNRFFFIDRKAVVNYVPVKTVTYLILKFIKEDRFDNEIYNVNSPMTIQSFVDILKSELGIRRNTAALPFWLLYPFAHLFSILPAKFQWFNIEKYNELTNTKVIPVDKLKQIILFDDQQMLAKGLGDLVSFYKKENLI
jgi:nucleoside-diphosphate-sugar epimerase